MANFLLKYVFRIAIGTLNFVSPSIVADILLHPFDFATVLLQIGYDPEGVKYEGATLVSVIVQYALFTFYIPYLLTSMQGLQFMGMPHPSIFYYVSYIYSKEGLLGCYRGLVPKIFERMIMFNVNERVKRKINKDGIRESSTDIEDEINDNKFVQTLMNNVCSQFFAVLASHPFHVLTVSSFAEFTYDKRSSVFELLQSIYIDDGYFGFFTGLTARLLGELLSLIFSLTYTTIINKQLRPQQATETPQPPPAAPHLVNYVTDCSRFTAFKLSKAVGQQNLEDTTISENLSPRGRNRRSVVTRYYECFCNFVDDITHTSTLGDSRRITRIRSHRIPPLMECIPLTSKLFYYIMIRDFLSKKISNPFFLVCHCAIVLDSGWDKFPLVTYLFPLVNFIEVYVAPSRKNRSLRKKFLNVFNS